MIAATLLVVSWDVNADTLRPADASTESATQQRREARGWLELDIEQRAYRDRPPKLDLQQRRQLDALERSQRVDLRAAQQRHQRTLEQSQRERRLSPPGNLGAPTLPMRDNAADIRRRAERHRLDIRSQQDAMSFRRR
jgi:hypothetical protein